MWIKFIHILRFFKQRIYPKDVDASARLYYIFNAINLVLGNIGVAIFRGDAVIFKDHDSINFTDTIRAVFSPKGCLLFKYFFIFQLNSRNLATFTNYSQLPNYMVGGRGWGCQIVLKNIPGQTNDSISDVY